MLFLAIPNHDFLQTNVSDIRICCCAAMDVPHHFDSLQVQQDVVHKRDVCGYTCDDFFGAAWQYMYRMESLAKGKGLYIQYVMTKDNTLNMMNQLDAGVKVSGVELAKAAAYSDVLKKSGTGQNMVTKQLAAHCRLQTGKNAQKALMNGPGGGTEPEATDIVGMVLGTFENV